MPVKPDAIAMPTNGYVKSGMPFAEAPKVYGLKHYGNPDHIRFAMRFQAADRKKKNTQADLYGRTVAAIMKQFTCSEGYAKKSMGGFYAYRMAVFANEVPTMAGALVEDLRRISSKAEADGDYSASVSALKEIAKISGVYAPLKVEATVQHTVGPNAQDQLRAALQILSPAARAGLELALAEMEQAKQDGRLQLTSGDEDEPTPAEPEDVEDAEVIETASVGVPTVIPK